jgi:hypothetical protein
MTRVNVYSQTDEWSEGKPELLGWFDPASAERFEQAKEWDGNNIIGVITGSQWIDEYLYRTKGGRWIRNHDAHRYMNGPDTYEFLTDEQAKDWLLRSGNHDDVIERFFGDIPEENGPGRPEIGSAVHVRLGGLLTAVDAYAEANGIKRAEAVRRLVADGLDSAEELNDRIGRIEAGAEL